LAEQGGRRRDRVTTETRNADPASAARAVTRAIARGQAPAKVALQENRFDVRARSAAELAALAAACRRPHPVHAGESARRPHGARACSACTRAGGGDDFAATR